MLPTFTTSRPGPEFSPGRLAFATVASLVLYAGFVLTQTVRHRDFFLPVAADGGVLQEEEHAAAPTTQEAAVSFGLLLVAWWPLSGWRRWSLRRSRTGWRRWASRRRS